MVNSNKPTRIGIVCDSNNAGKAEQLASQLHLPLVGSQCTDPAAYFDLLVCINESGLSLKLPAQPQIKPFFIDLVATFEQIAHPKAKFKHSILAKALQKHWNSGLTIFDATCGLANDCLLFLFLGFKVIATEKNPIVAALVQDGICRAKTHRLLGPLLTSNLDYYTKNALEILPSFESSPSEPSIIYLDPMFDQQKKRALSNRNIQYLQHLFTQSTTQEVTELYQASQRCAKKKILVKLPLNAPLTAEKPEYQYKGKSIRYDMYLTSPFVH